MERRNFIKNTLSTSLGASILPVGAFAYSKTTENKPKKYPYQLKYAPHIGMFKNLAGDDVLYQLNFMSDQGFTASEAHEMPHRPLVQQSAVLKFMEKRCNAMGVFVAHTIYWSELNLTSGNLDKRAELLKEIKSAVEVAKRVHAK